MHKFIITVFLFLLVTKVKSQIFPKEGALLTFRVIRFTYPEAESERVKTLEIAAGYDSTELTFNRNIIKSIKSKSNNAIVEVPSFGKYYTWRVSYTNSKSNIVKGKLHHFSTSIIPYVDTAVTKFRVLHKAEKYKDAYVFLDGTRALYDMNGNPVWYLPDLDGLMSPPADLKITPFGTITCIVNQQAYELNYNGEILWKAPNNGFVNGDTIEYFHHEFTRLANGNYMVMGNEFIKQKVKMAGLPNMPTPNLPPGMHAPDPNRFVEMRKPYSTLIEYDKKGKIVWSWKTSSYFIGSDVDNFKPANGMFTDVHENSFFFDEGKKHIYISCRNISRILKISYPEGEVLNNYGEIFKKGETEKGNGMYCGQHSCRISKKGYLYLYNNNVCEKESLPKVVMMKEPTNEKDSLKVIWEYECSMEGDGPKKFDGGGNVLELPDNSIFVSMNRPYSKVFIVSKEKEILWSAISEKWDEAEQKWDMVPIYRASIISDAASFNELIMNR